MQAAFQTQAVTDALARFEPTVDMNDVRKAVEELLG